MYQLVFLVDDLMVSLSGVFQFIAFINHVWQALIKSQVVELMLCFPSLSSKVKVDI